jgi:hypothetical protein
MKSICNESWVRVERRFIVIASRSGMINRSPSIANPCHIVHQQKDLPQKILPLHTTMKFILAVLAITGVAQAAEEKDDLAHVVTLGTRPYYLVDEMNDGALKEKLGESI